jgi:hypothetical protein
VSTPQYPNGPQEQGNQNPDYPTQPGYPQQPNYPPQPSYPQPAYPSQPLYPQYGDQQPGFGYGAPPSQYPGQYPGQPPYGGPPPQKPNRLPLILGIVAGVVLLCVVASVCAIAGPLQSALRNARATVTAQSGTETVAATATPAEQVIYQDSLKDSSSSNGWTNDVKCPFKADGFHVTASVVCFAPPEEVADATITVTATQISGATNRFKGIAFRHPTKGNFYSFQVDALGHWFVDKSSAGAGTVLIKQQVNAAIRTGTGVANTLTVQMTGGHFVFSANGTALGSVDDSDFATGDVGLLGDDQADMLFTDLKITKPAA